MRSKLHFLAAMALVIVALGMAAASHAQAIVVHSTITGDDTIGNQLVYAIKEQIRKSASLKLVLTDEESGFQLLMTTLDPDKNTVNAGRQTIYSLVLTMAMRKTRNSQPLRLYVTDTVGVCGARAVSSCALSVVAAIDKSITMLATVITQELLKQAP